MIAGFMFAMWTVGFAYFLHGVWAQMHEGEQ